MTTIRRALLSLLPAKRDSAREGRAFAPHCDAAILHSPGTCEYCDHYPDWQQYREVAGIAFTDQGSAARVAGRLVPCPSTYWRSAEVRDRWPGNRPSR